MFVSFEEVDFKSLRPCQALVMQVYITPKCSICNLFEGHLEYKSFRHGELSLNLTVEMKFVSQCISKPLKNFGSYNKF